MKNNYEICGEVTKIICNHNFHGEREVLISTVDLQRAKEFTGTWFLSAKDKNPYVYGVTKKNRKQTRHALHRWISNVPLGMVIDHINHDTLDNRKENLRVVTHAQNCQNKKGPSSRNTSGYRNVTWHKPGKKWLVKVKSGDMQKHIGMFDDLEEANKAAIEARRKYMPFSKEAR